MTDETEVSSAGNEEIQVDEAGSSSKAEPTAGKSKDDKDYKKLYHATLGQVYKLKDELKYKSQPKDEEDIEGIDPNLLPVIERVAEKKAKQILENKEKTELDAKEESAFLAANPQAYEKLEELRDMKARNPQLSYAKIYKVFFDEEPEPPKQASIKGTPPKTVYTENDLSRDSVNASLNKLMGRGN